MPGTHSKDVSQSTRQVQALVAPTAPPGAVGTCTLHAPPRGAIWPHTSVSEPWRRENSPPKGQFLSSRSFSQGRAKHAAEMTSSELKVSTVPLGHDGASKYISPRRGGGERGPELGLHRRFTARQGCRGRGSQVTGDTPGCTWLAGRALPLPRPLRSSPHGTTGAQETGPRGGGGGGCGVLGPESSVTPRDGGGGGSHMPVTGAGCQPALKHQVERGKPVTRAQCPPHPAYRGGGGRGGERGDPHGASAAARTWSGSSGSCLHDSGHPT